MNQGPYIGIAGITSRAEIDAIVDGYPDDAPPLAMGVLGSYKTLIQHRPNKYPNRYPAADEIRAIFSTDYRVRNVLHYSFAEDDMDPPRCGQTLWNELNEIRELTWPRDVWLQVNARPMIRPWHAEAIAKAAEQWSGVIVQVSGAAIDAWLAAMGRSVGNEMRHVLATLAPRGLDTTLLFDASGGNGVPVDVERIAPLIAFCHKLGWPCGVAGGLSPETLPALRPLFEICPLSVDTESWPRDADDRLDIGKALAFRDAARELYR